MLAIDFLLVSIILILWGINTASKNRCRFFPLIIVIVLILVMGLRKDVGRDYPSYKMLYNNIDYVYTKWLEPSWIIFIHTLRSMDFKDRMFFFLTSLLTMYGYYYGIKKLSPNIYLSLLLFIVIGLYAETANTIRQCVAQAILFAGADAYINKRWSHYAIFCITAVFAHYSAIMGIILMLICLIKFPRWLLALLLGATFIGGHTIMEVITQYTMPIFAAAKKYRYTEEMYSSGITSGALQFFYNLVGILILVCYNKLTKLKKEMYILCNLVLVGFFVYNTFITHMTANRIRQYCIPFIIILLPYLAQIFKPVSRFVIVGLTVLIFLLFLLKTDFSHNYNFSVSFL